MPGSYAKRAEVRLTGWLGKRERFVVGMVIFWMHDSLHLRHFASLLLRHFASLVRHSLTPILTANVFFHVLGYAEHENHWKKMSKNLKGRQNDDERYIF